MALVTGNNKAFRSVINKETHELIFVESERVLLRSRLDEQLIYVNLNEAVIEEFNIEVAVEQEAGDVSELSEANTNMEMDTANVKKVWTRDATLNLIELYKDMEDKFKSTKIKNDRVWNEIAEKMKTKGLNFTVNQYKERWKYIKMRYFKKKDNKKRVTGEPPVAFEYEAELDEIFVKKPNLNPVAIASSSNTSIRVDESESRSKSLGDPVHTLSESDEEVPKKRRRETEQEARERRHKEKLEKQTEAINTYKSLMEKLIDKL